METPMSDAHDTYTSEYHGDRATEHETLLTEAVRLHALRERVQRRYGPTPATRGVAPVGQHQRAFWADARTARPVAEAPVAPTPKPLPPARPDVATGLALTGGEVGRWWRNVRAAWVLRPWPRLRALRFGEGAMPG